ncbi:hypothetical protein [Flectobacillus roseus]|uniref:hypothetical protein n=1 Tax=Flectobacillus roseus TaxID=502259 RepID=UPI0024B83031|nr:hypothetical protein [Flectobacillus roseus]MDI9870028.1 hypothetical protein [Flectobacillus roseus]
MNTQTTEIKDKSKVQTNLERYIQNTGKTEAEYKAWATQVGRKMHINTLDKLICATMNIYSVSHLSYLTTEISDLMSQEQLADYLFEHSQNPLEIAQLWQSAKTEENAWLDKNSVINEYLKPFPKTDFERWGDKNWLADVSKSWFNKEGLNLDVQIQEMNHLYELEITIDDVLEFVRTYRRNTYSSPAAQKVRALESRFKELTSFALKDYYAEHLIKANTFTQTIQTEDVPF